MKYIKKPKVIIESVKLPPNDVRLEVDEWMEFFPQWFIDAARRRDIYPSADEKGAYIKTPNGDLYVAYGEYYIVRGLDDEIFPVAAPMFEELYEVYNGAEE